MNHIKPRQTQTGFSLVEMAIVLAIVALLLGGLLPTLSGQMEQQHRSETRKQLEEIRAALVGYAASQTPPRLPCPADPTKPTGTTGAGIEDCTRTVGAIPWATLGTSETDAWGRRFTYAAPTTFTSTATGFSLSSTSTFSVQAKNGGTVIASNLPAIIVSHGTNGLGAYLPIGTQIPTDATHIDELANSDGGVPLPFVSHDLSSDFDDLVVWVSPNILFNRMIAAGKLP
jgi:prepilin-type N-terminal cleavage/methylation domain-containing protein